MAVAITCPVADGNVISTTGPIRILGWSVRGVATCTVDLTEGGAGGRVLATINLASATNSTQWLGDDGLICNSGVLYAECGGTSAGIVGSIWIA